MAGWKAKGDGEGGGRPRLWTGLIALVAFVVAGIAFAPGLIRPKAEAPTPWTGEQEAAATQVAEAVPPADSYDSRGATPLAPIQPSQGTGDFDCMVQPSEVIDVGSSITGLIDAIPVERGDYVEAGQVLAQLESHVEEAAVRVAIANAAREGDIESSEASLELNRKRSKRAFDLFASNSLSLDLRETVETEERLSAAKLKEAEENQELASLRLEQARATLDRRTIRSPVSGFVVERLMARGEVVDEETIMRVAQVDPLRVEVILPVSMFGSIQAGDTAHITPEAPMNQPRVAQVAIVDRVIDGASATFGAQLTLPNPDQSLPAGLRCRVRFEPSERSGS